MPSPFIYEYPSNNNCIWVNETGGNPLRSRIGRVPTRVGRPPVLLDGDIVAVPICPLNNLAVFPFDPINFSFRFENGKTSLRPNRYLIKITPGIAAVIVTSTRSNRLVTSNAL